MSIDAKDGQNRKEKAIFATMGRLSLAPLGPFSKVHKERGLPTVLFVSSRTMAKSRQSRREGEAAEQGQDKSQRTRLMRESQQFRDRGRRVGS